MSRAIAGCRDNASAIFVSGPSVTSVNPGFARTVQMARRDAGLHVADHIQLVLDLDREAGDAVGSHRRYLMEQTLADDLELAPLGRSGFDYEARYDVGRSRSVGIGLSRVD